MRQHCPSTTLSTIRVRRSSIRLRTHPPGIRGDEAVAPLWLAINRPAKRSSRIIPTRALRHDDHSRGSVRKEWGGSPGSRTCRSPACPGSPRPSSQSSKWMATATGREPPAEGPLAANSRGEHLRVASAAGWRGISPIGFPSEREPWQKAPEVCSFREAATNQRLKDGLLAANSGCVHSHPAPAAIKDLVGFDSPQDEGDAQNWCRCQDRVRVATAGPGTSAMAQKGNRAFPDGSAPNRGTRSSPLLCPPSN